MINPNEVRLSNLVRYKGKEYEIYGLTKERPYLNTLEFGPLNIEWKDLEPIEVSEKYVTECLRSVWHYDSWNGKYLHQLQNLYFALTGNELNYKNEPE